jgi:hypothetical protein
MKGNVAEGMARTEGMAHGMTGRDLVTRLLDVTPPPTENAAVDDLLAAFDGILAERAAILEALVPPITLSEIDRPLLAELERRQKIWHEALAAALRRVGEQRCGAQQLRAYAGPR